ncbi:hypothetical protein [Bizionia arctica]|uniref:Beta-lactamase-inhibitor-like PepSY-like domain-containing protein n=1 Tax=Bizionia arctica TaxID=1495645 RepID=A0A917GK81_9FLAO|nr:hypothetical protein [Bizionia arctica]GGG49049.1 hypothetical protein GCM10010976_20480 [Bizionia arctica]
MKTIYYNIIMVLLFTTTTAINAQDEGTTIPIKQDIVPNAIQNSVKSEFPNYEITGYSGIPRKTANDEFIEESNGGIVDEFEAITVSLKGEDDELLATYSFEGILMSVMSNKPTIDIPQEVTHKVNKAYPDWIIINYYRHLLGDTITDYVVIKNGSKTITLFSDEDGSFVEH